MWPGGTPLMKTTSLRFDLLVLLRWFSLSQVGIFYNQVLNEEEKFRLCDNIASHLCNAQEFLQVRTTLRIFLIDDHTQERAINNFSAADKEYGRKIKELIDTKYGKKKENVKANL